MMEARMKMLRYILIVCSGVFIIQTAAIRCYTDLEATQVNSFHLSLSLSPIENFSLPESKESNLGFSGGFNNELLVSISGVRAGDRLCQDPEEISGL